MSVTSTVRTLVGKGIEYVIDTDSRTLFVFIDGKMMYRS